MSNDCQSGSGPKFKDYSMQDENRNKVDQIPGHLWNYSWLDRLVVVRAGYFRGVGSFAALLVILVTTTGCPSPASLNGEWGIPPQEPMGGEPASLNMAIIADNQIQHLYGEPVWLRSGFTNQVVSVAIRPVQLDFYATAILQWTVENIGDRLPVIHLGDALNAACAWEWDTFVSIMNRTGRGWFMAPGNHDSYYFGNGHFALDDWLRVCDTGDGEDGRMTKDRLVESYLRALADQQLLTLPAVLASDGVLSVSGSAAETSSGSNVIDLEEVAWRIDRQRPWRSFVVQRLNVTLQNSPEKVVVVLLDTNQYAHRPRLVPWWFNLRNSGVSGEVLADQIAVVDSWLAQDQINFLMGHHPFDVITRKGKTAIDRWRGAPGLALYVSAHTHRAQWFVHEGATSNWLELNVGSTTDWSPEYRTLYAEQAELAGKTGLRTQRQQIWQLWDAQCETEWEVDPDSPYSYIRYRDLVTPDPTRTQVALMNTLLATHSWAIQKIRSSTDNTEWPVGTGSDEEVIAKIRNTIEGSSSLDARVTFTRELRDFDAARRVENADDQKQFRLCQAMWSSKYDLDGARAPNADDAYLLVPKE